MNHMVESPPGTKDQVFEYVLSQGQCRRGKVPGMSKCTYSDVT